MPNNQTTEPNTKQPSSALPTAMDYGLGFGAMILFQLMGLLIADGPLERIVVFSFGATTALLGWKLGPRCRNWWVERGL